MPTAHSILTADDLHHNVGDSRSARAWTLAAGAANALLIENSNNNDILAVTTSVTPGSTTIVFGNATDLPAISLRGTTTIEGPLASSIFTISTNSGGDIPLRVDTAATAPHSIRLSESYLQLTELGTGDPTNVANAGLLYTKDNATVTDLYYRDSAGTVHQLTPAATGTIGGNVGANDNRVVRTDGIGGLTIQNSVVALTDVGEFSGVTGYSQTSGAFTVTGNGLTTIGNGGTGTIDVVPGSGGLNIALIDNDSAAMSVAEAGNVYMRFVTTNSGEQVQIGNATATLDVSVTAGDDVVMAVGNDVLIDVGSLGVSTTAFRVRDGADTAQVYLTVDTSADVVTIGNATTGATGVVINTGTTGLTMNIADNDAAAWDVLQGGNIYFRVATTNSAEAMTFGGASNPRFNFGGTNAIGRPDSAGTDTAGVDMRIRAGAGTGAGTAGLLYLATPSTQGTGTTVQTHTDRVIVGGTSTTTLVAIGNPDADNSVATPVTDAVIRGTAGSGAAQGTDVSVIAGGNTSTGRGGHFIGAGGFSVGAAVGGDASLVAGDADTGTPGYVRLATNGDVDGAGTDRLMIEPNGAVQFAYQGATSMPVHYVERYRYTHNSADQTVLTYPVASGSSVWVDIRAVWSRTAATTGSALATVFGGCWNDGGTTDEIGGSTFASTMVARSGQASTDGVDINVQADNATDELEIHLTKSNANDYTVDLYITVHATA